MSVTRDGLPFWLDEPYEPRPPLAAALRVEACVVGAGVGGLSCARRLAAYLGDPAGSRDNEIRC